MDTIMGKIDKKRKKLISRIEQLENEMTLALTKKDSNSSEISVGENWCDQEEVAVYKSTDYIDINPKLFNPKHFLK